MHRNFFSVLRQKDAIFQGFRMASTSSIQGKLSGKVAIVTASTEGIGLAIARRLGQDGASVMVSSRKQDNVSRTVEQLKSENLQVEGMVCHVGKAEDRTSLIQQTVSKFGGLDFVTPESAWDKIFETNVKATFFLIKEAVPHMEKRGGGSVFLGPYSVSKTALIGMTKALVPQLSTMNIRVNCVAPGIIKTKIGEPSEISGLVSFLCSDDASYITGETTLATGGIPGRL
ncbi:DHRS4-like protein [Mya arenaria]|uniref:DHRS4-like protein n=1 Tax=Mya arenaria TaxID=6604 RepID=A0ABY7EQ12_MYAAR|nr:DHRS4-like protein [Mya arenaria]